MAQAAQSKKKGRAANQAKPLSPSGEKIPCGIVMPISAMGECSEGHWAEVLSIVSDAVDVAGFRAQLVSNADEITIIQKTIVQNLYNSPVVVCDVSERNANVMFELGMRLAFDKPTVIIKDDKTPFSFDTGVIEHLEYPRDLRFPRVVEFKKRLAEKVLATHEKQSADPNFSTFLRHFGRFKVAAIEEKEVSGQEFIMEQLTAIQKRVENLTAPFTPTRRPLNYPAGNELDICCGGLTEKEVTVLKDVVLSEDNIQSARVVSVDNHLHLFAASDVESIPARRELEIKYRDLGRSLRNKPTRRLPKKPSETAH